MQLLGGNITIATDLSILDFIKLFAAKISHIPSINLIAHTAGATKARSSA